MKITALLPMLLALLVSGAPALAQTTAQSSPEDRQRFVTIVHKLEKTPLDAGVRSDRGWAIQWLTDAPDVSVTVCSDMLGGVLEERYAQHPIVIAQYMLGMGAFVVEHPDKASDSDAVQLAGVESALTVYRAVRADQPSPALDKLAALKDRGELPGFVRQTFRKKCKGGG